MLTAYEKYQLEWMIDHGYSLKDLINKLTEIYDDVADLACSLSPKETFNIFEYETGFKGSEIWACEDEWEDNERQEHTLKCFEVRTGDGYFRVDESQDPDYPGIDVEFIADNEDKQSLSRPRVLFEKPIDGALRVLIWNDKDSEDYSEEIEFEEGN